MSIDSTSGREGDVIAWLDRVPRGPRLAHAAHSRVTEGRDDCSRRCIDAPLVTLSTHLDTVPPFIPPRREDGQILRPRRVRRQGHRRGDDLRRRAAARARGAAGRAACSSSAKRSPTTARTRPTRRSRRGSCRATSRVIINGEPTESTLALGTKGAIRVTVRTRGQAAHSAYPHLGHSATRDLVQPARRARRRRPFRRRRCSARRR